MPSPHTDNDQQQVDPTTGRVIPTREQVRVDIERLANQHDIISLGDLSKVLTAYVMIQISQNYQSNVNLGISIGRKEMVAAMETVIPKEHENTDVPSDRLNAQEDGEVIGWNNAREEMQQRLKAMVGVLEKGSSPSAVDVPAQGHEADNLSAESAPEEER